MHKLKYMVKMGLLIVLCVGFFLVLAPLLGIYVLPILYDIFPSGAIYNATAGILGFLLTPVFPLILTFYIYYNFKWRFKGVYVNEIYSSTQQKIQKQHLKDQQGNEKGEWR